MEKRQRVSVKYARERSRSKGILPQATVIGVYVAIRNNWGNYQRRVTGS
jgi:hypothetical protein